MFSRHSTRMVAVGSAVALSLPVLILFLLAYRHHVSADVSLTPTPILPGATLGPATGMQKSTALAPAASFLTLVRGKVLHYTISSYSYDASSPDPANGQNVSIDTWVQVGVDGSVVAQHAISRLPSGAFLQETLTVDGRNTVALGPQYAALESRFDGGCLRSNASRQPILPLVVDSASLAAIGYAPVVGLPVNISSLAHTPPAGPTPEKTLSVASSAATWQQKTGPNTTYQLEVQFDGKLDVTRSITVDNQGKAVRENRQGYGVITVYDTASIGSSTFALSTDGQEICHA